ncbi:hypothetical protein N3K66_008741 [Trichothecium roseum]|uniref:Uncharacterized protein n=1 Tax=Trichothecium roseum TaxID=47278 RepID=A0ACC0UQZ7_9HYPO|nr:hypothetical protein N3K66_008741 [Trichothecium roseum]
MLAITTENGSRSPGAQTPKAAGGSNRYSLFSEDSDDGTISVNLRIPRLAFDESDYLVASKQTPAYARLLVERWAFDNRQMHAGAPSLLRTTKLCVQALNLSVHRDWVAAVERKDEPARCFLKNIKQAVTNYENRLEADYDAERAELKRKLEQSEDGDVPLTEEEMRAYQLHLY